MTKNIRRAILIVIFQILVIVFANVPSVNAVNEPVKSPYETTWVATSSLSVGAMGVKNLRTFRTDGSIGYFLDQGAGGKGTCHIGILDFHDFNAPQVTSLIPLPFDSYPYDLRNITVDGVHYVYVGLKTVGDVLTFKVNDYGSNGSETLELIDRTYTGIGTMKMIIDSSRKLLFTPNSTENTISVLNIADPTHPVLNDKITVYGKSPARVQTLGNGRIVVINGYGGTSTQPDGTINIFNVVPDESGTYKLQMEKSLPTFGNAPYYGDPTANGLFVIGNTGDNSIAFFDISHPEDVSFVAKLEVPYCPSPLIAAYIKGTDAVTMSCQGWSSAADKNRHPNEEGSGVLTINIADKNSPYVTSYSSRPYLGGGTEILQQKPGNKTMFTIDSNATPGCISRYDISNPEYPEFVDKTILPLNDQAHYLKSLPDAHHLIATGKTGNNFIFLTEFDSNTGEVATY